MHVAASSSRLREDSVQFPPMEPSLLRSHLPIPTSRTSSRDPAAPRHPLQHLHPLSRAPTCSTRCPARRPPNVALSSPALSKLSLHRPGAHRGHILAALRGAGVPLVLKSILRHLGSVVPGHAGRQAHCHDQALSDRRHAVSNTRDTKARPKAGPANIHPHLKPSSSFIIR